MATRRIYSIKTRQLGAKAYKDIQDSGKAIIKGKEITSVKEILALLDVKNESTLRGWAKVNAWDRESVKKRFSKRGRKKFLDEDEEKKLKQYNN
jgi:hypothetical protein